MSTRSFWIYLGGIPLWVKATYAYTVNLFQNYCITPSGEDAKVYEDLIRRAGFPENEPVFVSDQEISVEFEIAQNPDISVDILESLALYRKLCELLLHKDILLFHASALAMDGNAYLFTAPSGTGKSTHAGLWRERFGSRVTMINDDKPLIRFAEDNRIWVYGTPYCGKEGLQTNTSAQAAGIVILQQASRNRIHRLSFQEAYPLLLDQTYRNTSSPQAMRHTLDLVFRLAGLPVFFMDCTISQEAAGIACQALKGAEL